MDNKAKLVCNRKVVITGGECSGKTSVIQNISQDGFLVVEEAAILIIDAINKIIGVRGQIEWWKNNPWAFQELIWRKTTLLEDMVSNDAGTVFFDRGIFDGLAYLDELSRQEERFFREKYAVNRKYDAVFVLQTLNDFKDRYESGRASTYENSKRISKKLFDIYCGEGILTQMVPVMSIKDRCSWIYCHLPWTEGIDVQQQEKNIE